MGRHNVGALLVVVYNRLLGIFTDRLTCFSAFSSRVSTLSQPDCSEFIHEIPSRFMKSPTSEIVFGSSGPMNFGICP